MAKLFNGVARLLAISALMAIAGMSGAQQPYPNKPIRFIVPYTPGGASDDLARHVGQKLTESWGQPVIVDNRPGGNTIIGSEAVAKSPPDGYSILFVSMAHVINPLLVAKLPFDALKDFAPVATLTQSRYVLTINASLPAGTLQEFIAYARSRPGQLNYATSGMGSPAHLTAELFNMMTGAKMQHVPYKGAAQILLDLAGGQVQMYLASALSVMPYVKAGKIKPLAIVGKTRASVLPQVPTFIEAGVPEFDEKNWFGVVAPAKTPRPIIEKLSAEIGRIITTPEAGVRLASQGGEAFVSTPEQFSALLKSDMAKFAKVIKVANIRLQ